MKYLSGLVFLIFIVFIGWPYVHVYHLNSAVNTNNQVVLATLVDIEAIQKNHKENLQQGLNSTVQETVGNNALSNIIAEGANALGNAAVNTLIDINWVQTQLNNKAQGDFWAQTTYAFFESPSNFTVRLGELGQNPLLVEMTLQDWSWKITGIYQ